MTLDQYDDVPYDGPTRREINLLAWRERLDPRDPDALDEDELAKLDALRSWEP